MASAEERAAAVMANIDAEKLRQDKTADDLAFAGKQQQAVVWNEKNLHVIENIKPEGYVRGLSTASADKQDDSQD